MKPEKDEELPSQDEVTTKLKTLLPKKLLPNDQDLKETKFKENAFDKLCGNILKTSEKLAFFEDSTEREGMLQSSNQQSPNPLNDNVYEIDRHIHHGKVCGFIQLSQEMKEQYGLGQHGICYQFTLNSEFLVIIIGRMPYTLPDDIEIALYIPKRMLLENKSNCQANDIMSGLKTLTVGTQNSQSVCTLQMIPVCRQLEQIDGDFMNYAYFMVEPQNLMYPSYLCSWIDCKRKITIEHYVQGESGTNQNLVFGSACHRYMEWLIDGKLKIDFSEQNLKDSALQIYQSFTYDMYLIEASFESFYDYCQKGLSHIRFWVQNYLFDQRQIEVNKYEKIYLKITSILGSQTMHRSKYFGLKGKTDGLFQGVLMNKKKGSKTEVYIPFELKTGKKVSNSHKKQTDIYSLLIREKYRSKVFGLLYYSETDQSVFRDENPSVAFETIVIHRNHILVNLFNLFKCKDLILPQFASPLDNCKYCSSVEMCESLHAVSKSQHSMSTAHEQINEQINEQVSQTRSIEDYLQGEHPSQYSARFQKGQGQHMDSERFEYLRKWIRWLHLQEYESRQAVSKFQKNYFLKFTLRPSQLMSIKQSTKNQGKRARFWIEKRVKTADQLSEISTFYIVAQKMRIIIGPIGLLQSCKITETKKKKNAFYMQVEMNNKQIRFDSRKLDYFFSQGLEADADIQRFDNQFYSSMRRNVYQFLTSENSFWEPLRKIITSDDKVSEAQQLQLVKNRECNSKEAKMQSMIDLLDESDESSNSRAQPQKIENDQAPQVEIKQSDVQRLNKDQERAFRMSINSPLFTMVEGMPGTGKTELIIRLIQKFCCLGRQVLVTTFTNRSLDNILERLLASNKVNPELFAREGSRYSIDQRFESFSSVRQQFKTVEDYQKFFSCKSVWFVTLSSLSIHHIPKQFDVVILDEASQAVEALAIQAVSRAKKIIMIGDYKQLQPIIKSDTAEKEGMSISLFERLCLKYPECTVALKYQYRMNKQIMRFSNKLVYQESLLVGGQEVADRKLSLKEDWKSFCDDETLKILVNPDSPIVFLNHDGVVRALSCKYRDREVEIQTTLEVQIAYYLLKSFIKLGVAKEEISVIAAYNETVEKISSLVKKYHVPMATIRPQIGCESILTIDKSQGIDKEVIILLLEVRKHRQLLQNPRRLNVALTRAKCKLILIGSNSYISSLSVWGGKLIEMLEGDQIEIRKAFIDEILKDLSQTDTK